MSEHEKAQKVAMRTDELARLRAENERLKQELEISWDDLPGAIDDLDDVIHQGCKQLLRQCAKDLRALRRPLEQGDDALRALRDRADERHGNTWRQFTPKELLSVFRALDTNSRQLRERVEMLEAAQREICELKEERAEYLETNSQTNKMLLEIGPQLLSERKARAAAEKEIARLSSPPQERAEIAQSIEEYRAQLRGEGLLSFGNGSECLEHVSNLLGDCAAWRNALGISWDALSERNRECVELREQRDLHQARKDLVRQQAERIERLEGALRKIIADWDRIDSGGYVHGKHIGQARLLLLEHSALAAADGQEISNGTV